MSGGRYMSMGIDRKRVMYRAIAPKRRRAGRCISVARGFLSGPNFRRSGACKARDGVALGKIICGPYCVGAMATASGG